MTGAVGAPTPATDIARDGAFGGILYLMFAVFLFSVMDALIKWMTAGYDVFQVIFFRSLFTFVPIGMLIARAGGLASLRTRRLGAHLAPASLIAPFEYSAMLWAVLFGYLVFGDLPGAWMGAGVALVIASGLYIVHREAVVARRRKTA